MFTIFGRVHYKPKSVLQTVPKEHKRIKKFGMGTIPSETWPRFI